MLEFLMVSSFQFVVFASLKMILTKLLLDQELNDTENGQ